MSLDVCHGRLTVTVFFLEGLFRFFLCSSAFLSLVNVNSRKLLQRQNRGVFIETLQDKLGSNFCYIFSP